MYVCPCHIAGNNLLFHYSNCIRECSRKSKTFMHKYSDNLVYENNIFAMGQLITNNTTTLIYLISTTFVSTLRLYCYWTNHATRPQMRLTVQWLLQHCHSFESNHIISAGSGSDVRHQIRKWDDVLAARSTPTRDWMGQENLVKFKHSFPRCILETILHVCVSLPYCRQ